MPAKTTSRTVTFTATLPTLAKETPGTYVFTTKDPASPVKQQYIAKSAFPDGPPKSIEIVVTATY